MKYSQFNIIIPYSDKWVLFNTLSQRTMILSTELKNLLNGHTETLSKVHPAFHAALIQNNMLVSDTKDELTDVQELIRSVDFSEDSYRLIINPTLDCNFHCWYCYENHIKSSQMNPDTIEKVKLLIDNITKKDKLKEFRLSFFGGEPLLYFNQVIVPITQYAIEATQRNNIRLISHITSNGYLANSAIQPALQDLQIHSFQITLDGNREKHDSTRYITSQIGSYDKIIQNIKSLISIGIHVILRMNYTQENIDGMKTVVDDLSTMSTTEKQLIILSLNQVWQDKKNKDKAICTKAENLKEYAQENGIYANSTLSADTVRNSCYADKCNQAVINYDGLVYKCNARNFSDQQPEGILTASGEIEWNSIYHQRMNAKLKNKPCLTCTILPMCGGGCRQYVMEHTNQEFCIYDFDENKKIEFVKEFLFSDSLSFETV